MPIIRDGKVVAASTENTIIAEVGMEGAQGVSDQPHVPRKR